MILTLLPPFQPLMPKLLSATNFPSVLLAISKVKPHHQRIPVMSQPVSKVMVAAAAPRNLALQPLSADP